MAELNKFTVANFAHLALGFGPNPGTAVFLIKKAHFTNKIAGVEIGQNHFFAVAIIFNNHGN